MVSVALVLQTQCGPVSIKTSQDRYELTEKTGTIPETSRIFANQEKQHPLAGDAKAVPKASGA
jgi:hypothetical protein